MLACHDTSLLSAPTCAQFLLIMADPQLQWLEVLGATEGGSELTQTGLALHADTEIDWHALKMVCQQ